MRHEEEDYVGSFDLSFRSPSKSASSDDAATVELEIRLIINILRDYVIQHEYQKLKSCNRNVRRFAIAGSLFLVVLGYGAYSMSGRKPGRSDAGNGPGGTGVTERQSKDSPPPTGGKEIEATPTTLNREAHEHYNRAQFLRSKGNIDEALVEFRYAVSKNPDYAEAHFNIGQILQSKDEQYWNEAIIEYRRAIKSKEEYAEAHFNVGQILRQKHDLDGAILEFKRVLKLKPGHKKAEKNLSEIEQIEDSSGND